MKLQPHVLLVVFCSVGSDTISGRGSSEVSTVWMVIQMKYYSNIWYYRDYKVFHSDECSRSYFLIPFSLFPPASPLPRSLFRIFFPNCASLPHSMMLHEVLILKNKILLEGYGWLPFGGPHALSKLFLPP